MLFFSLCTPQSVFSNKTLFKWWRGRKKSDGQGGRKVSSDRQGIEDRGLTRAREREREGSEAESEVRCFCCVSIIHPNANCVLLMLMFIPFFHFFLFWLSSSLFNSLSSLPILMASFFLRRKIFSRSLLGSKDPLRAYFQFKFDCLSSASSTKVHPYTTSTHGAIRNDFTDFTSPHTWYPQARRKHRRIILHVGPTNSGKTH